MILKTNNPKVDNFMREVSFKLRSENLIDNPFRGYAIELGDGYWNLVMSPVYPPIHWIGIMATISFWVFFGFNWWLAFPAFLILPGILYTDIGIYICLCIALIIKGIYSIPKPVTRRQMRGRII
jgi:hypothetical protein